MELADKSKLGKGEKDVRKAEKKKAILRIREGMKEKEMSRAKQNLEEVSSLTELSENVGVILMCLWLYSRLRMSATITPH